MTVQLCVLSGGAGNRLWPVSRETQPKQFYDFSGSGAPLIVDTVRRLKDFGPVSVLTNEALVFATQGLLNRYNGKAEVLGEPLRKNTAPAAALFTWKMLQEDPLAVVGIFPSDHVVKNQKVWAESLQIAFAEAAKGKVVTFGMRPSFASDGFGYIELPAAISLNSTLPFTSTVLKFVEKPSVTKAESFLATGRYVWNAGMFVFRVQEMAQHFARLMPDLWIEISKLKKDLSNLKEVFEAVPSESLDYGVMEKLQDICCVVTDFDWSDVGSWEEVVQHQASDLRSIQVYGQNNHHTAFETQARQVAFVGVSDVVLVETPDSLLVMRKGSGQRLRDVVKELKEKSPSLLKAHSFEERPWGRFEVLQDTSHFKSKKITVWPGHKLSYQSHKHRAEHWVVVKGEAEVTLEDQIIKLKVGEHVHIPLGAKHRMANRGKEVMEFIEVQTGTYFGEDDIVRYSDDYGRQ